MLEESMQRLPILRVGNATMIVPKDANPKDFLPKYYHEYLDVFDRKQANSLPPHRSWDHAIELNPGKQSPVARPYSMNQHELKALRDYLEKELSKGFIRVSRSPAAAPVLFVKKANGELRFCIDYRGLNAITIRNRHSLPLISETLSQLSKAKYYTKLDVISAFNKLRIKEGDEWKAAFTCRYGLFEPLVMPFGLCNGPASFQAYINHALRGFLDQFCTAYMDDILIYSENLNDHRGHVSKVLQRLRETGLQVDISKCSFEATEVTYLGLIVSTDGIRIDPKKVACVQEWPTPRSVRDIQRFLGFANFYRRFIPEFSRLATPSTTLTKKGVQFSWNDRCESAFFRIKQAFIDEIMLAHFDPHRQTILETDASDFETAAILSQYDDSGKLRPIAFMSKKMLPAECKYEIFDKELLAIVNAFETWTAELGSVEASTLVLTDHKKLEYFTTTKKLNRRQVRWNELLADYDFKIVFRPGKLGGKPDALTRINADKPFNDDDIRNTHQHQTLLKPSQIISCLESAQASPSNSPEKEPVSYPISLVEEWEEHCNQDKYCQEIRMALKDPNAKRADIQLASCTLTPHSFSLNNKEYVPQTLREILLSQLHSSPLYGHRGAAALYYRLTKRVWIIPVERPSAHDTAEDFLHYVVRFAGLPDSLISDQGRAFIDKTWKETCSRLKITHKLSTSYHPETDGQTERANETLEVYLRHYVNYHQDDWVKHRPLTEFCCNNNINASTEVSPFFASFGHHPRLDFRPESECPQPRNTPEFITRMKSLVQQCAEQIAFAQAYHASYANDNRLPAPRFKVGDYAYLSLKNLALERPSKKLDHIRAGPWRIIAMKTPLVAKLDLPFQFKIDNNFHVSLLRPAYVGFASQQNIVPPPFEISPSGHEVHEVEAILDSRIRCKKVQYLVRWTGDNNTTWEPYEHLDGCPDLLSEFHNSYPNAPRSQELAS
ncbi:hypothetical protein K3495_g8806 [Podosphaera aphanis]|nr:hypothetical protein K3495_g8806 [Podosphaera aphanis]